MANYNETTEQATAYTRAASVVISNPLGATPTVQFFEDRVVTLGGITTSTPLGQLPAVFDPAGVIQLRDPATGELTGQTTTQGDVYAALYSFYIQSALQRDAQ